MTTSIGDSATGSRAATPAALVLLCRDLQRNAPGIDLAEVASWLSDHLEGVRVRLVEGLCQDAGAVGDALRDSPSRGLVLGLCTGDYPEIEVHTQARSAGVDPLSVQAVNLDASHGPGVSPSAGSARAKAMLAASVARAVAFSGSQPENLKATLAASGQRVSRRALFTLPPISYVSVPTIDGSLCTAAEGCDQCVRACPYDALGKESDTIHLVSRTNCRSCGVCVAVCPYGAVELPGWSPEELEAQVSSLIATETGVDSRAVAFVCRDSSQPPSSGRLPVSVPCIAMVTAGAILQTVARGANEVTLVPCRDECPMGLDETIRGRVDYCRELLRLLGGPTESERVGLLDPLGAPGSGPGPGSSSLAGEPPKGSISLFGRGVAAEAVLKLAARHGAADLALEHPYSPLGIVRIDGQACTGCGTCANECPTQALSQESREDDVIVSFDASLCTACGLCELVCPERAAGAIAVSHTTDLGHLSRGKQTVFRGEEVRCERCGAPVATRAMLERVAAILGEDFSPQHMARRCAACRGI